MIGKNQYINMLVPENNSLRISNNYNQFNKKFNSKKVSRNKIKVVN